MNAVFQELVDTYTIDNDAVMVQVKDDGSVSISVNEVRFYDYTGNLHGPKLHIEYETGAAAAPPPCHPAMIFQIPAIV